MTALSLIVFAGVAASIILLAMAFGIGGTRPQLAKRAASLRDRAQGKSARSIAKEAAAASLRRTQGRSMPIQARAAVSSSGSGYHTTLPTAR